MSNVGNMYSVYIKDLPYYADTYKHYLVLLKTFAEVTKYFFFNIPAMRHGRYTVAIRTKTILEVKQLKEKAENVNKTPSLETSPTPITHITDHSPSIPKLDNLLPVNTTLPKPQGLDAPVISPAVPSIHSSNYSIPSVSSQTTEGSVDFIASPGNFMTLSPAPYQMDAFSDSDITSLFEDLSSPYLHSETQQLEFKMEDLADSFLDQPETSVDFLEDLTLSLQEKSPVEDVTKDDPGMKLQFDEKLITFNSQSNTCIYMFISMLI